MSTRALYAAIGLGGYQHVAAWEGNGEFKLRLDPPESAVRCPGCGSTDVIRRGIFERRVHAPPIGLRKTIVFIRAPTTSRFKGTYPMPYWCSIAFTL